MMVRAKGQFGAMQICQTFFVFTKAQCPLVQWNTLLFFQSLTKIFCQNSKPKFFQTVRKFFLILCRRWHPSLSGAPSSALLLPSLTSGPDLGARPDCWVSVEFLHATIPRKGSGSTTTTRFFQVYYSVKNDRLTTLDDYYKWILYSGLQTFWLS